MSQAKGILFPYMEWAQSESFRSPYSLAQSGMPLPATEVLGGLAPEEWLAYPSTDALPQLEGRLAELYGVDPQAVIVTPGATGALHLCSQAWFRPGSRVAVEAPGYQGLRALPHHLGAEVAHMERRPEQDWLVDPEYVAQLLAGSDQGHVLLTNPHNPSGAVLPDGALASIAAASARQHGITVCCEVYMEYGPAEARRHIATEAPNGVTIGSLSKAHGLGPLRIGWIILGEGLLHERRRLVDLAHLTWIDPPTASLMLARRALDHLPELLQPARQAEQESRPHLLRWLSETAGVSGTAGPFGILSFPRIHALRNTHAFASFLAEQYLVDVVPGEYFGRAGHLRISCGVPEATLTEGLARLTDGLRAWLEQTESP